MIFLLDHHHNPHPSLIQRHYKSTQKYRETKWVSGSYPIPGRPKVGLGIIGLIVEVLRSELPRKRQRCSILCRLPHPISIRRCSFVLFLCCCTSLHSLQQNYSPPITTYNNEGSKTCEREWNKMQ